MGAVLVVGHTAVADLEHVWVVPRAGARGRGVLSGDVEQRQHAVPGVVDVGRGPPQVAGRRAPLPRRGGTPLADAEDDGAPRPGERVAELGVLGGRVEPFRVAPVLFDVIHAPLGERAGVEIFGPVGPGPALTRPASGVRVEPEPESPGVDVIRERLHPAGKADSVRHEPASGVARHLPAVVDDDVLIAGVAQPVRRHGVGGFLDELGAHVAPEVVPAVPAHGRRAGHAVVEQRGRDAGEAQQRHGQDPEQRTHRKPPGHHRPHRVSASSPCDSICRSTMS